MDGHEPVAQETPQKARFFYGYLIIGLGFLIMLIGSGILNSYGIFLKPLSSEFGWTRAATSGAYSLAFLLQGTLGIFTGRLTDKLGPRLLVTASGVLMGLGCFLMSQTGAIWQLYLFFGVLIGTSRSCILVPVLSTVSRWFVRKRGMAAGIVMAGVGVGQAIIPPISSQLIATQGWRTSYVILGIISLVTVVAAAQFLKHSPYQMGLLPDGTGDPGQKGVSSGAARDLSTQETMRTWQFWILFVIYFCLGFFSISTMVHLVPHATDLGIPAVKAATIISTVGALSIAGRIIMGSLSDRIDKRKGLIVSFILTTGSLFWLQLAREPWAFYLFAAVFGFAWGGPIALQSPILAEFFGMRAHGAILGVIIFGVSMGGTIGPYIAGYTFDVTGNYQLVFLIFTILSLTSLITAIFLKPAVKTERMTG